MDKKLPLLFHIFLFLFFFFWGDLPTASAQQYEWAGKFGGSGFEFGNAVALDQHGNVYVTGIFTDTVDFDPGPGEAKIFPGDNNRYIVKLDAAGNYVWAKHMGGISPEFGDAIKIDPNGNFYAIGNFRDTADFDPGSGFYQLFSEGSSDCFIQKLDSLGNLLWVKQTGGVSDDGVFSLTLDHQNNILMTGRFRDTVDFDPGPGTEILASTGYFDVFIQKLDADGNHLWSKRMGAIQGDFGNDIAVDKQGNIFTTGGFRGHVDFDPNQDTSLLSSAFGSIDVFIQKLDAAGNFLWAKSIGANGTDWGVSLDTDSAGNVYVMGQFWGTVDFDPGPDTLYMTGNALSGDIFILKLDGTGNLVWAQVLGPQSGLEGKHLKVDESGNVYLTGAFWGTVDFDPGPASVNINSEGDLDIFIQKIDTDGNFLWARGMGGTSGDYGYSIVVDQGENVFITGRFRDSVDFNLGASDEILVAEGAWDAFIAKYSPCSQTVATQITDTACNSYSLNGETYTESGNYTQHYVSANGCDSIIELALTLNKTAYHITDTTDCHGYTLNGQSYTESGIYTQVLTNSVGCDSTITLDLTIDVPTFTLVDSACSSYTLNNEIYTSSGIYTQILTNTSGCDSILTLDLTLLKTSFALGDTACRSYTLNNQTYTSSGIYTQTLLNSAGCDSTISLFLYVENPDTSVTQNGSTLTANHTGFYLTYQWIDCGAGNIPVSGATSQTFTPTSSGLYAVVLEDNWCLDTSACYSVILDRIDQAFDASIAIYPNPAKDYLTIETDDILSDAEILIIDLNGQTLFRQSVSQISKKHVFLPALVPGMYFIRISDREKTSIKKIMIL